MKRSSRNVSNDGTEEQPQAETVPGFQKADEHGWRQAGDKPPAGEGKKTPRCVAYGRDSEDAVYIPQKRAVANKQGICFDAEGKKAVR